MKPTRKKNRLQTYDYSSPGVYFITVCAHQKKSLFWTAGATIGRPCDAMLSECGKIVRQCIEEISSRYPMVQVNHFVVMPNHVHLLLSILSDAGGRPMAAPTISRIIAQMKGAAAKQAGIPLRQKSFHDHVVRGEADYRMIYDYIDTNPERWQDDCFYPEKEADEIP